MNNNRQIAKQKFDEHFMFKDNPIAWTAWKMAFQLGIEHQQALRQTDCYVPLLDEIKNISLMAQQKLAKHEHRPLSEAAIEARTVIQVCEHLLGFVLSNGT